MLVGSKNENKCLVSDTWNIIVFMTRQEKEKCKQETESHLSNFNAERNDLTRIPHQPLAATLNINLIFVGLDVPDCTSD